MKAQQKSATGLAEALTRNLMTLATAYAKAKNVRLSMVGVHVRNDQRFFTDKVPRGAFTAVVYDATVRWFDENWPEGATKPRL